MAQALKRLQPHVHREDLSYTAAQHKKETTVTLLWTQRAHTHYAITFMGLLPQARVPLPLGTPR